MPYFGVPIRNGLPIGLGTLTALAQAVAVVVPPPVSTDPYFEYVSLLANTNETNGAQNNTFLDSSTNAFSITRNGNTTQGTFSPFSQTGWSNFFDGTGDYLSLADNAALNMGSSDFTIESWVYTNSATTGQIVEKDGTSAVSWPQYNLCITSGGKFEAVLSTTTTSSPPGSPSARLTGTTTVQVGTWYHVAMTRVGTNATLWVNGVSEATSSAVPATLNTRNQPATIGTNNNAGTGATFLNGYLSNTRIVKGTAVYTSNFTPPTSPLTNITNTSLLTCQSNRFIDNSSNAFAITRNGDVSVQAFSPFNPTAAWSAGTNGGSGYFDGTGDYLSVPRNNAFLPVANEDFTFEAWVYLTATPGATEAQILGLGEYGTDADWFLGINSSLQVGLYLNSTLTFYRNTNTALTLNSWNHVAASRSGTGSNNLKVYVNGVGQSFTTNATTIFSGNRDLTIGADQNGDESNLTGYISNARIVKGTAVYTANFTPPTAPLTAITNTSLLCNFTNAGIFDSASGNDLETVGNAQVSTTQAKFGTTSMAFDGAASTRLTFPSRPIVAFRTSPYTIEAWIYLSSHASTQTTIVDLGNATGSLNVTVSTTGALQLREAGVGVTLSSAAGAISLNTWAHIAVVRQSTAANATSLYVNGVSVAVGTDSINYTVTTNPCVGGINTAGFTLNGYIDDLRITNGYARYTANFTPPTAAFPLN